MEVLLVRHAIAVERSRDMPDPARPLARRGIDRFTRAVSGLAAVDLTIDHVLHSPWLRAVQTAALLHPVLRGGREPTELLASTPGDELLALAARHPDSARVALVGHEPWMGELLSLLVVGTIDRGDQFPFKKGGVAWLAGTPAAGSMRLRAMLPPKVLRGLAPPVRPV